MKRYTVRQLARLSGVSVRALHHYDAIGLLKPAFVGGNRYRYYGRDELLRLQDILCHRELGVPLHEIARLPAKDGTERLALLAAHRLRLVERVQRARQLLATIDRTIAELNGDGTMDDHELYKGFSPEKQAKHERYLVDPMAACRRTSIAARPRALRRATSSAPPRSRRGKPPQWRCATPSLRERRRTMPRSIPRSIGIAAGSRGCGTGPAHPRPMRGSATSIARTPISGPGSKSPPKG